MLGTLGLAPLCMVRLVLVIVPMGSLVRVDPTTPESHEMWGVWGTGEFTVNFTTFTCGEFHQWCEFMVKFTTCESHQREFTFCKIQTKCEKYVNFTTCENQHEFRLFTHIGRLGCGPVSAAYIYDICMK